MSNKACVITHPQTGSKVLVYPGESFEGAIERYNIYILGYTPDGPAQFDPDPRPLERYTHAQLQSMRGSVTTLQDPDTLEDISFAEYVLRYDH